MPRASSAAHSAATAAMPTSSRCRAIRRTASTSAPTDSAGNDMLARSIISTTDLPLDPRETPAHSELRR